MGLNAKKTSLYLLNSVHHRAQKKFLLKRGGREQDFLRHCNTTHIRDDQERAFEEEKLFFSSSFGEVISTLKKKKYVTGFFYTFEVIR